MGLLLALAVLACSSRALKKMSLLLGLAVRARSSRVLEMAPACGMSCHIKPSQAKPSQAKPSQAMPCPVMSCCVASSRIVLLCHAASRRVVKRAAVALPTNLPLRLTQLTVKPRTLTPLILLQLILMPLTFTPLTLSPLTLMRSRTSVRHPRFLVLVRVPVFRSSFSCGVKRLSGHILKFNLFSYFPCRCVCCVLF